MSKMYSINPYEGEIKYYAEITQKRNQMKHSVIECMRIIESNYIENMKQAEKIAEVLKELDEENSGIVHDEMKSLRYVMQRVISDTHNTKYKILELIEKYCT